MWNNWRKFNIGHSFGDNQLKLIRKTIFESTSSVTIYKKIVYPGAGGGGTSREEFIDIVAVDIVGKLPSEYEIWRVRKQFEMNITPTLVVLLQELER